MRNALLSIAILGGALLLGSCSSPGYSIGAGPSGTEYAGIDLDKEVSVLAAEDPHRGTPRIRSPRPRSARLAQTKPSERWAIFPKNSKVAATPLGFILEFEGRGKMEAPFSGGKAAGQELDLGSSMGIGDRDDGVGATFSYGDGFGGVELSVIRWEQQTVRMNGIMEADFGHLDQNDTVKTDILLNQIRLDYIKSLFEHKVSSVTLRAGLGFGLHHNEVRMKAEDTGSIRKQNLKYKDKYGAPLLRARFEAEAKPFRVRCDLGYSEGDYGGIEGTLFDWAFTLHYKVQRGVTGFAGYWHYQLPGAGAQEDLEFRIDGELNGYMAGLRWDF